MRPLSICFVFQYVLMGCPAGNLGSHEKAAFAEEMYDRQYPYRAIGVVRSDTGHGTGVLVAPHVVVTNRHVIMDDDGNMRSGLTFEANYVNGSAVYKSRATYVRYGGTAIDDDWAVLKLATPIGVEAGYFTIDSNSPETLIERGGHYTLVGFGSRQPGRGKIAHIDRNVSLQRMAGGMISHNGTSSPGASGGPIFYMHKDTAYLVAIHARGNDTTKLAVCAERFAEALRLVAAEPISELTIQIHNTAAVHRRVFITNQNRTILGSAYCPPQTTTEISLPTVTENRAVGVFVDRTLITTGVIYRNTLNSALIP